MRKQSIKIEENEKNIFEIKDTNRVYQSKQLRAQVEIANDKGIKPILITGKYTEISNWVKDNFNIYRTKLLGPKKAP